MRTACTGPYDALYLGRRLLWEATPGRMVWRAAETLRAGRALDLGCGDGKNAVFLESLGWRVDGIDISELACLAAHRRWSDSGFERRGWIACADVTRAQFAPQTYDLVIAYGLAHCLSDRGIRAVWAKIRHALRPRGVLALAAFTNDLPLPADHGTREIVLRPASMTLDLCASQDWERIDIRTGEIEEAHEPVIGMHRHSMVWALARRSY